MKLSDLYEALSSGELSNLSLVSGEDGGTILEAKRPKIVIYLNDALTKLHSRFVLIERGLIVQLSASIGEYRLLPRFAASYEPAEGEPSEPVRYIRDSESDPFIGDVIKVMSIFDSCHHDLPLNDEGHALSVFTPQANLLQVPCPSAQRQLSVTYQARHPKIQGNLDEDIEIPDVLEGALKSYIAYKAFSHMNSQDSNAKAQEFLATYEAECASAVDMDLVNSSVSTTNTRFHQRGWV